MSVTTEFTEPTPAYNLQPEKVATTDHHGRSGSPLKSLAAGAVGGTLEVLTDHPIDVVKVRMQTSTSGPMTVVGTISRILRNDGFVGLYRGASVRVATLMPATAISFWGYDIGKQLVNSTNKQWSHTEQVCLAGAFSGLPVTLFATPSERIKCLLQIQEKAATATYYEGPLHCARELVRTGGLSSLYRGLGITLARNIPGYGVWFGTFEIVKKQIETHTPGLSPILTTIVSGGLAGSISWAVMIPFDVIKSVIQTSPHPISIGKAYRQVTAKQGTKALLRGMGPAVLIAFPANAMCFLGMELSFDLMTHMER